MIQCSPTTGAYHMRLKDKSRVGMIDDKTQYYTTMNDVSFFLQLIFIFSRHSNTVRRDLCI